MPASSNWSQSNVINSAAATLSIGSNDLEAQDCESIHEESEPEMTPGINLGTSSPNRRRRQSSGEQIHSRNTSDSDSLERTFSGAIRCAESEAGDIKPAHAVHTSHTAQASGTSLEPEGFTARLSASSTANVLKHQEANLNFRDEGRPPNPRGIAPPAATLQYLRQVSNVQFTKALLAQKPKLWTRNMFKFYCILLVGFINSAINGFDGSIMGGINAMDQYQKYFHMETAGSTTGIVFMIYAVGNLCGSLVVGPITDSWGRRWGMFMGSAIVIAGAAVQGSAYSHWMFLGGRFILGFGVSISVVAGPTYVAEMAHPAWRGPMTGLYNTFYYFGAISAGWIMYGTEGIKSDLSWRLPVWLQAIAASLVVFTSVFVPETPRWLISNDCNEGAINVITQYYGEGNRRSPIVLLTYKEMVREIVLEGSDKRWWDFSELWDTPGARRRLNLVAAMAILGQWTGNGMLTYFLPVLLDGVGITDQSVQLFNNAALYVAAWICSVAGALLVDKVGRRPMLLGGAFSFVILWSIIAGLTGAFADADRVVSNRPGAKATMAMIYFFNLVFSFSFTSLQILYPVECLKYETRAKGMGLLNLVINLAIIFNTYGMAVIIQKIRWNFCFIYIVWNMIAFIYIYIFFVETKDRTLEEINEIFAADNPVKTSLKKHIIIVTETEQFLQDYIPGGEQDAAAATELQHLPPNKATDT